MAESFSVGWRQVGVCLVFLTVTAMIATSYGVIAVPLGHEFHPSRMVLMLAMTVVAGGSALLSPWFGSLMDRVPLRRLIGIGAICLAAGYAALSLAQTFTQVLVVFGLLIAPANVLIGPTATTVLLSRWFVRRRGTAIGIAIAGVGLGGFIFPPLIQMLLNTFDWRTALRVLALILLIVTGPAVALVVERPSARGLFPDGGDHDPEAAARQAVGKPISALTIMSDPTFWLAALVCAIVSSGVKGVVTNLVPMAVGEGINANAAALLISMYSGCAFLSKLGFAAIADRINTRYLIILSLVGFAVGNAILSRAGGGYLAMAVAVGLLGLFGGIMVAVQQYLVPRIFGPAIVGRGGGLLTFVVLLFLLSTPPLFGWVFDRTGSYDTIFVIFAALGAAACAAVPYIRLHPRELPLAPQELAEPAE